MSDARTPRGGWHFYFRRPLGKTWKISSSVLEHAVDVRTDGGYTVEFPSETEHGRYTWVEHLRPHELLPAPPRWNKPAQSPPPPSLAWLVSVLDHHYPPEPPPEAPLGYSPPPEPRADGTKPGDDSNARGTWEEAGIFEAGRGSLHPFRPANPPKEIAESKRHLPRSLPSSQPATLP